MIDGMIRMMLIAVVLAFAISLSSCSKDNVDDVLVYETICEQQWYYEAEGRWISSNVVKTTGELNYFTIAGVVFKVVSKERCKRCETGKTGDSAFYCNWLDK